jgi:fructokinase
MNTSRGPIVGIGEILWDLLPDGPQLGGAPFNFTFHCHQLGWPAVMVSRIGNDERGQQIRTRLAELGLSGDYLQSDGKHPTGTVSVRLVDGQPSYTIHEDVAWDFLDFDPPLKGLMASAAALCFGTLAQRRPASHAAIRDALRAAKGAKIVCDVNLRQTYWSKEVMEESLRASHWVKLNNVELVRLHGTLPLGPYAEAESAERLRQRYDLELVCLTRGEKGCLVRTATETIEEPGLPVTVVDTIGAGDAFTAGLVVSVLEGRPLREAVRRANRLAAAVAGARGGTPQIDPAILDQPPA